MGGGDSRAIKSFGVGSMALKSGDVVPMADQQNFCCSGQADVALGGGNVVAAFRSMRKTLATRRGDSVPRAPGAMLKSMKKGASLAPRVSAIRSSKTVLPPLAPSQRSK